MNNFPKQLIIDESKDLKLGIKSSLRKVKPSLALIYFLWIANEKPSTLDYSNEIYDSDGNQFLVLNEKVSDKLIGYLIVNNLIDKTEIENVIEKVNENLLFTSQIEALKVAFELIYKLTTIKFVNSSRGYNAERKNVNGKSFRYSKRIEYSSEMDLLELFIKQIVEINNKVLLNWMLESKISSEMEKSLIDLFTYLSDDAIFRLRTSETTDIKFNMGGIYESLYEIPNGKVNISDYKENMGSLRILHNILSENLNSFISKDKNDATLKVSENIDGLYKYAQRIKTSVSLTNKDLTSLIRNEYNSEVIKEDNEDYHVDTKIPYQRIFFGAPGTGKSFELNKEVKKYFKQEFHRVTFHPNYLYGAFVGSFKPFQKVLKDKQGNLLKDENGNIQESITYRYVPGILLSLIIKAIKNPEKVHCLVIEEINRANVSAVFGDTFQLLDRDENGFSEYAIETSEEMKIFLQESFLDAAPNNMMKQCLGENFDKLRLPSNLYIWSTMNSADQGVMPMDTAFRRRWDFTYLGINDAADLNPDFENYFIKVNDGEQAKWDDVRRAINEKLMNCGLPEDKLIGPYFISKNIMDNSDYIELTDVVKYKVIMYLYEDAGKPYRNAIFESEKHNTFSQTLRNFDKNVLTLFNGGIEVATFPIK